MPRAPKTLQKRRDFLACARARRWSKLGLVLQARARAENEAEGLRVGYTCSKKIGNAVARNKAKRRLRAAAAEVLTRLGQNGWDYVLIGRAGATISRPFDGLVADLEDAVSKVHASRNSRA